VTLFKICGLQTAEHAIFARECGATFLGFVFVNGVRRELSLSNAAELIEKYRSVCGDGGPSLVGLFADQPIDMVNEIIGKCGLDYVQLCGREEIDYWAEIESKVIKQIRIDGSKERAEIVEWLNLEMDAIAINNAIPLLDRYESGQLGGTGKTFDWTITTELAHGIEYILAGGLNHQNVSLAISTARPWAVDVSSGVENRGEKDFCKIQKFSEAVSQNA